MAAMQAHMQRVLLNDLGPSFQAQHTQTNVEAQTTITRCLYKDVFEREETPQLLQACCCSQDASWCALIACRDLSI